MLRSLDSGVSAMQQFQQQMDVIGNNIANVNTTGFKAARVDFEDAFSQTLQGGGTSGSMQVGTGTATSSISNMFTQGTITRGSTNDLAINGDGFFLVRNATTGAQYATRDGSFERNASGYLVKDGLRVQGLSNGAQGDLLIDATGAPATAAAGATYDSFTIDKEGNINVKLSDGTVFVRGQITLQKFASSESLLKEGNNLYSGLATAGPVLAQPQAAGTNGLGTLELGSLEMSNVDLTNEFATMITAQRAFQASAKIITTSDEILQEVVNLKR